MSSRSAIRLRTIMMMLVACALIATACGSETTVLQGDTGSEPAGEPAAATAPTPEASSTDTQAQRGATRSNTDEIAEPDAPQIVLTGEEPTPVPPATPAVLTSQVGPGGAVAQTGSLQVAVGASTATNALLPSFIDGEPELSEDENWLITTVALDSLVDQDHSFLPTHFRLEDTAGQVHEPERVYLASGRFEQSSWSMSGRNHGEIRLAFSTDELVADTTGWHLLVGASGELPLTLPLAGPAYATAYPIALPDGQESKIDLGTYAFCVDGIVLATTVESADISLDRIGRWNETQRSREQDLRVPIGERLVSIELTLTGLANLDDQVNANCSVSSLWPDFVLLVDGRPAQPVLQAVSSVHGRTSAPASFTFQIPASASRIELVGGAEMDSIGAWEISMPAAVGEPGATLVPFDAPILDSLFGSVGPRPAELVVSDVAAGGATGEIVLVEVAVGTTIAGNADLDSLLNGNPTLDEEGHTWLVVEVNLENTDPGFWTLHDETIVAVDPTGRPHAGVRIVDRVGQDVDFVRFDGPEFMELRVAFETDGLVQDAGDWTLQIDLGDAIPLVLPLQGQATTEWPVPLTTGQTETLTSDFAFCASPILEAEITAARVDIEGPWHIEANRELTRVDPEHRYVVVDVALFNAQVESMCGRIAFWPAFTLDVDGRLTLPFRHDRPVIEPATSETLTLNFRVPKDTQLVTLIGGDNQAIASWLLKDSQEVLQDFEAEVIDERTVITLDETLLFAFGQSTLQQGAIAPLNRVANVVNENSGQITIVGHTDSIGDDASNQALSLARAEAVAVALIEAGVDEARLEVSGEGETSPLAPNTTDDGGDNPAGRAQNRRVEISFDTGS